jgi:hypothetical protein
MKTVFWQTSLVSCLVSIIAMGSALGHDSRPIRSMIDPQGHPVSIGTFLLTQAELQTAVAMEHGLATRCVALQAQGLEAEDAVALETASYWRYSEPLFVVSGRLNCGGIEWRAAARLTRERCEEMSADIGLWPAAVPQVTWPTSFSLPDHHTEYHINDGGGIVQGECIYFTPVPPVENSTN